MFLGVPDAVLTVMKVIKAIAELKSDEQNGKVQLLCAMMRTPGSCPLGKCKVCRASFTSTSGSKKNLFLIKKRGM